MIDLFQQPGFNHCIDVLRTVLEEVSAELDELFSLADRIAVMFDGKIVGVLPVSEATHENIGLMMTGSLILN